MEEKEILEDQVCSCGPDCDCGCQEGEVCTCHGNCECEDICTCEESKSLDN